MMSCVALCLSVCLNWPSSTFAILIEQVSLNADAPTLNGANIWHNSESVSVNAANEYELRTVSHNGFDLRLSMDDSWSFVPGVNSSLRITIDGFTPYPERDTDVLLVFSVGDLQYFSFFLHLDLNYNIKSTIYASLGTNHTLPVSEWIVSKPWPERTRWTRISDNDQWTTITSSSKQRAEWPLTFVIINDELNKQCHFEFYQNATDTLAASWYFGASFEPNKNIDAYIMGDSLDEQFTVRSVHAKLTTEPTQTRNPTRNPSSSPENNPTTSPTFAPSVSPSAAPTTTQKPTPFPSLRPQPTLHPTMFPINSPSSWPSAVPTLSASSQPTTALTEYPTPEPTGRPMLMRYLPSSTLYPATLSPTEQSQNPTTGVTLLAIQNQVEKSASVRTTMSNTVQSKQPTAAIETSQTDENTETIVWVMLAVMACSSCALCLCIAGLVCRLQNERQKWGKLMRMAADLQQQPLNQMNPVNKSIFELITVPQNEPRYHVPVVSNSVIEMRFDAEEKAAALQPGVQNNGHDSAENMNLIAAKVPTIGKLSSIYSEGPDYEN